MKLQNARVWLLTSSHGMHTEPSWSCSVSCGDAAVIVPWLLLKHDEVIKGERGQDEISLAVTVEVTLAVCLGASQRGDSQSDSWGLSHLSCFLPLSFPRHHFFAPDDPSLLVSLPGCGTRVRTPSVAHSATLQVWQYQGRIRTKQLFAVLSRSSPAPAAPSFTVGMTFRHRRPPFPSTTLSHG